MKKSVLSKIFSLVLLAILVLSVSLIAVSCGDDEGDASGDAVYYDEDLYGDATGDAIEDLDFDADATGDAIEEK